MLNSDVDFVIGLPYLYNLITITTTSAARKREQEQWQGQGRQGSSYVMCQFYDCIAAPPPRCPLAPTAAAIQLQPRSNFIINWLAAIATTATTRLHSASKLQQEPIQIKLRGSPDRNGCKFHAMAATRGRGVCVGRTWQSLAAHPVQLVSTSCGRL